MEKIWTCKIGGEVAEWPHHAADVPMRHAIETAYQQVTGCASQFKITGWGGTLDLWERAAVDNRTPTIDEIERAEDDELTEHGHCDPWLLQTRLMRISDQHMADQPSLTSEGILYAALILEEVGELCAALVAPVAGVDVGPVHDILRRLAEVNGEAAKSIRDAVARDIAEHGAVRAPVSTEEAVEVADALTDIMVVTAGASLAMGMKGAACYRETQYSNLSKANPGTGVIDKDPSGKWIKGTGYFKPDLRGVLYGVTAVESEGGHVD